MDKYDKQGKDNRDSNEVFSKSVRAGNRTYFFDVKATKRNEYYLNITESKRKFDDSGKPFFEKHKIFLYKEDFEKFSDSLVDVFDFIKENQPEIEPYNEEEKSKFTDLNFDDLSK